MKIGIIGGGVVGRATARCFTEHAEVRVHDVIKERSTHPLECVLGCDLIFVCLPTPQKEGSLECNTSAVEDFFRRVSGKVNPDFMKASDQNFALRSTVPIGFTKRMSEEFDMPNLVHSPEFLTARCAMTDAQLPARNIVGVNGGMSDEDAENHWLVKLYQERFPGSPVHVMFSDASEAVKLMTNGFFATKIAYFNECFALCNKLGIDWTAVLPAILADGRISHSHTKVPGPDGKMGFGGSCLPKDLANLVSCLTEAGMDRTVCSSALTHRNDDVKCPMTFEPFSVEPPPFEGWNQRIKREVKR